MLQGRTDEGGEDSQVWEAAKGLGHPERLETPWVRVPGSWEALAQHGEGL